MLDKALDLLGNVISNGIMAILVALITCVVLAFATSLAMIPVSIIGGDAVAKMVQDFVYDWPWYRIIYAITFFELMAESYGFTGIKAIFRRCQRGWRKWRRQRATTAV